MITNKTKFWTGIGLIFSLMAIPILTILISSYGQEEFYKQVPCHDRGGNVILNQTCDEVSYLNQTGKILLIFIILFVGLLVLCFLIGLSRGFEPFSDWDETNFFGGEK